MLNIPESVKTLFQRDGVRKNFRVHFPNGELPDITNDNVVQESVKFTESLCSQDVLKFGLTEASTIEFETVGIGNMYGMTIECGIEIDLSSLSAAELAEIEADQGEGTYVALADSDIGFAFYRVPYGQFRVESCPRDHQAMAHRMVTAYSYTSDLSDTHFPELSESAKWWSSVNVDWQAILAQQFRVGITTGQNFPTLVPNVQYSNSVFHQSNGDAVYVQEIFRNGSSSWVTGIGTKPIYVNYTPDPSVYYTLPYSFIEWVGTEEEQAAYYAHGLAVVSAVNNAGYDLTYDSSGSKIYSDNLEAFLDIMPQLFSPCIQYTLTRGNGTGEILKAVPVKVNTLTPLIYGVISGYDSAFIHGSSGDNFEVTSIDFFVPATPDDPFTDHRVRVIAGSTSYLSISNEMPQTVNLKLYNLSSYSLKIPIKSTLENRTSNLDYIGNRFSCRTYYYANSYSVRNSINSALELHAMFAKVNRLGQIEMTQLSDSYAEPVSPPVFTNFWWDEYNVLPIGTVNYTFNKGDNDTEDSVKSYVFGSGGSIYDMTDNEILKGLKDASISVVESILDEMFIPYIGPIAFTPIELNMKGLPYLEAGDYLAVTAEDGTIAYSFAMRQTISGIQVLTAEIESTSGDIIESEEGGT